MSEKRYFFAFTAPYKVDDAAAMQRRAELRAAHVQRLIGLWDDGTIREYPFAFNTGVVLDPDRGAQNLVGRC